MTDRTPPLPTSQAEWEAHWAFYKLTVAQRDLAWRQEERLHNVIERLLATVEQYQDILHSVWLHGSWRALTKPLTTVEKEAFAYAVEVASDRLMADSPGGSGAGVERWWRDDYVAPVD
jgi:hypothetical protein